MRPFSPGWSQGGHGGNREGLIHPCFYTPLPHCIIPHPPHIHTWNTSGCSSEVNGRMPSPAATHVPVLSASAPELPQAPCSTTEASRGAEVALQSGAWCSADLYTMIW